MIYLKGWNFILPANTDKIIKLTCYVARGEFIPKEKILNYTLALLRIPKSNDKSVIFTRFLIIILATVAIVAALVSLLVYACQKRKSRLARELVNFKDKIFWNTILRTII